MTFNRNIDELQKNAVMWWPKQLQKDAADISCIPLLLGTQENFIAILRLCKQSPTQVFEVIEAAKFPANLFLKHLTILADYGGETTKRLNSNFHSIFLKEDGVDYLHMDSFFNGKVFRYKFEALPVTGELSNSKLGIDGEKISKEQALDPIKKDMIMILLFGASAKNALGADLQKCEIANLLGKDDELDKYVRQKYIWVSRITGGATSNTQGQLAQAIVCKFLQDDLGGDYRVISNGAIKLKGYDKDSGMPFDVVIEKAGKLLGVEVSFQVTTNSVIERKGGQAQERQNLMHQSGHKIAYIIDGAGNFQRRSAVSTICRFSDCTVAYSEDEFRVLAKFIRENI